MYTVILMGGREIEALILSATPDRLRVAIPGRADSAEFHLNEGRWTSESGAVVELAAIISTGTAEAAAIAGFSEDRARNAV